MNEAVEMEMRLMRLERTQALMLEKLDTIDGRLTAGAAAGKPAPQAREAGGLGIGTAAVLVVVLAAAAVWAVDELHLYRFLPHHIF